MGPRPVAGLLLDAMGTLIGLRQSVGSTYAALAERHGIQVDAAAIDRVFPQVYGAAPPLAFPGLGSEELAAAELAWWGDRIEEALGQPVSGELKRELFEHFGEPEQWRTYPEVASQLEKWKGRGLKLAVVSNFDQRLHRLLEGLGLSQWLDAVVISSAAGAAKPDPAPLQQALKLLDLAADQVWHVGDSAADQAAAAAAGIRCVLVKRP
ncbi:HAD-IA family hydrolase [Cyanobium sp. WAJ14-Wanaka]|uniref:HAD-IA family hydrolase n=1 Tax=Cyanobium sp. WAJ14-Wanaka TaxID=2823725 RepID=UPI0020CD29BA|nr:HAD-IA family hydrolase [Cyanobium sp. WAJ14-Wanaka]MCP9776182.1 HAD-IA family hydrolase [Cyanobium sp. WAJ14-Wanaka]